MCALISIVWRTQKNGEDDQAIGRSHGGLSTKIHALVDALGNPLEFLLTPGQAHDLQAERGHIGPRTDSQESGLHTRRRARDTRVVRTYGQYCSIAWGAEIFAERWTPLIIRNLYLGCGNFSEILEGSPGLSRTLLSQRLKQLERLSIVESAPKSDGRGHHYKLTSAGHELFKVCQTLGEWGARWLEIAPKHLDPFVALWSMCNALRRDRLPDRRVVIRFDFTGRPHVSAIGCLSSWETPRSVRRTPSIGTRLAGASCDDLCLHSDRGRWQQQPIRWGSGSCFR